MDKNKSTCSVEKCNRPHAARGFCKMHHKRWKKTGDAGPALPRLKHIEVIKAAIDIETDRCIYWPFALDKFGYGSAFIDGKQTTAHRVVRILVDGGVLGDRVLHDPAVCNNPTCINPKHLRWGTAKDNMDDKNIAGTMPKGESHWNAKLNASDVLKIKKDRRPIAEIALNYDIDKRYVRHIKSGSVWKHVL